MRVAAVSIRDDNDVERFGEPLKAGERERPCRLPPHRAGAPEPAQVCGQLRRRVMRRVEADAQQLHTALGDRTRQLLLEPRKVDAKPGAERGAPGVDEVHQNPRAAKVGEREPGPRLVLEGHHRKVGRPAAHGDPACCLAGEGSKPVGGCGEPEGTGEQHGGARQRSAPGSHWSQAWSGRHRFSEGWALAGAASSPREIRVANSSIAATTSTAAITATRSYGIHAETCTA